MASRSSDETLTTGDADDASPGHVTERPMLVCAWAPEIELVGAVLCPLGVEPAVFGRGSATTERARLILQRQRPGEPDRPCALESALVSRRQLEISATDGGISVRNLGKRALLDGRGRECAALVVRPGDAFEVRGQLVFVCVARPSALPPLRYLTRADLPAFGRPDQDGFVGESPLAHRLRDGVAFLAGRDAHVLVLGPSGSGKEIVARAIHRGSRRGNRPLVARNAATIPATLMDAELFGHQEGYPQAGMPARAGLVGEADGGTLFLDEIGELPDELQSRLLRFLDSGGDYQRLGDARKRTSSARVVAATNRPASALRLDLLARLKLRVTLPGLNERREDVLWLARHLLESGARDDPGVRARFFHPTTGEPRLAPALVRALVAHRYTAHVRELDALLWSAIATSPADVVDLTPEVTQELFAATADTADGGTSVRTSPPIPTKQEVERALDRTGWIHERAWRELGLANRYVLKRLVKKYALTRPGDG